VPLAVKAGAGTRSRRCTRRPFGGAVAFAGFRFKRSLSHADGSLVVHLRHWQLVIVAVGLLVAGFVPTLAFSQSGASRGTGTTIMLVISGQTTTMSSAAVEKKVTTGMTAAAAKKAQIIVVVNGRVVANSPASSYRDFALDAARNAGNGECPQLDRLDRVV